MYKGLSTRSLLCFEFVERTFISYIVKGKIVH